MSEATLKLLPQGGANKRVHRRTPLNGRQITWTPEMVHRLVVLWVARFHYSTIAEVLVVTPRAASSKASRVSLPSHCGMVLSKDVDAARRVDALNIPMPKILVTRTGQQLIGRQCNLSGNWFYGSCGIRTSVETKLTEYYKRMQSAA